MSAYLKLLPLLSALYLVPLEAAVYQLIPIPLSTTARSVSNNGWVAGNAGARKAFIWSQAAELQLLGDLPGGIVSSVALCVNDAGQVVGESAVQTNNHAFLWDAQSGMRDIGNIAGSNASYASGINASGHIVITSNSSTGFSAYLRMPDGTVQNIGDLPGEANDVFGADINDQNQIVGHISANGLINAFLWDPVAGMTSLGDLPTGSNVSYGFGLNNGTQLVGRGNTSDGDRAFLWGGTTGMQNLGTMPNGYGSYAYGINNNAQVVGHFTLSGQHRAFLWTATSGMADLNLLADAEAAGWLLMEAYDVNDSGWIVGQGVNPQDAYQGFLLIPNSSVVGDIAPAGAPDGQINIADLMRLLRFVTKLEVPSGHDVFAADINGDGALDVRDVLALYQMLE